MDQVRVVVNEDIGTVQLCASVMRGVLERQAVVTVIYENRGAMGKFIYHFEHLNNIIHEFVQVVSSIHVNAITHNHPIPSILYGQT